MLVPHGNVPFLLVTGDILRTIWLQADPFLYIILSKEVFFTLLVIFSKQQFRLGEMAPLSQHIPHWDRAQVKLVDGEVKCGCSACSSPQGFCMEYV